MAVISKEHSQWYSIYSWIKLSFMHHNKGEPMGSVPCMYKVGGGHSFDAIHVILQLTNDVSIVITTTNSGLTPANCNSKRWWTIHYRHYLHHRYCISFSVGPQLMQAWMLFKINSHRFWTIWLLLVTGSNLWLSVLLYCHMVKHYPEWSQQYQDELYCARFAVAMVEWCKNDMASQHPVLQMMTITHNRVSNFQFLCMSLDITATPSSKIGLPHKLQKKNRHTARCLVWNYIMEDKCFILTPGWSKL